MEEYDVRLSDGSVIVVKATSPERALEIAAQIIAQQDAALQGAQQPAEQAGQEVMETAADVAAGVSRGATPYIAAAGLGAMAGGGLPGAVAGVGAMGLSQFVGDPLVDSVNALFGTQLTKPTDALQALMDAAGMPRPQTEAGQMAQAITSGAAGALGGVSAARSIAAGAAPGTLTQRVAQVSAEAPVAQTVAGATGAGAAEQARQMGASPLVQMAAGLGGGILGGMGTSLLAGRTGMPRGGPFNLEQDFSSRTGVSLRIPMGPSAQAKAVPMTYEDIARDTRIAATGGMGSQQAVERLARAAAINPEAAAAAERLGINVPPDVLIDHTQLKEAIGLTRSMPGTVASAAWFDAVQNAATQADEAIRLIDGSADLSEVSDAVLNSMSKTQKDLQTQADELYARIRAKIEGAEAAPAGGGPAPAGGRAAAPETAKTLGTSLFGRPVAGRTQITKTLDDAEFNRISQNIVKENPLNLAADLDETTFRRLYENATDQQLRQILKSPGGAKKFNLATPEDMKGASRERLLEMLYNRSLDAAEERGFIRFTTPEPSPAGVSSAPPPEAPPLSAGAAPGKPPPVDMINSRQLMNKIVGELNGDTSQLTGLEKQLLEMSGIGREKPISYQALMRMKNDVGQALNKATGIYKDVNQAVLKRLYGALSEDQLNYVTQVGGPELRADLRLANQLVAKRKALEDRVISLFGSNADGSIARKLVSTLQSGAKGDISGFNRVVRSIPEDLRKRAIASAIAGAAREEKTNGFGFSKYVNLYQGLRRNSEVYKTVATTLGPDGDKFMRDLYEISKRITDARANVKTTGQANQALVQAMTAEGLVEQVMKSTIGKQTIMGAATAMGGAAAGPVAGAGVAMLTNALSQAPKKALNAAGDLFASPEWQQLVINISTENVVNQKLFNAAKGSKAFQNWTKSAGITDPDQWLRTAIGATIGTGISGMMGGERQSEIQPRRGREATE